MDHGFPLEQALRTEKGFVTFFKKCIAEQRLLDQGQIFKDIKDKKAVVLNGKPFGIYSFVPHAKDPEMAHSLDLYFGLLPPK